MTADLKEALSSFNRRHGDAVCCRPITGQSLRADSIPHVLLHLLFMTAANLRCTTTSDHWEDSRLFNC